MKKYSVKSHLDNLLPSKKIVKIGSNVFNKTSNLIEEFTIYDSSLEHAPPKYDIEKMFNQMTKLRKLRTGLNVSKISSNLFQKQKQLMKLEILLQENTTIKSSAFDQLTSIDDIKLSCQSKKHLSIESGALKFISHKTNGIISVTFSHCSFQGNQFEFGFDNGTQRDIKIIFSQSNINYLNEKVFKPFLNDHKYDHAIKFDFYSVIDCEDCGNFWLIKENKQIKVENPHCKGQYERLLFDEDVKANLTQKCK